MRLTGSAASRWRSSGSWTTSHAPDRPDRAIPAMREKRGVSRFLGSSKGLRALADPVGASRGFVRVVDESGEDYFYPSEYFVAVELPQAAARVFAGAM